jgi:hypothetical protein
MVIEICEPLVLEAVAAAPLFFARVWGRPTIGFVDDHDASAREEPAEA